MKYLQRFFVAQLCGFHSQMFVWIQSCLPETATKQIPHIYLFIVNFNAYGYLPLDKPQSIAMSRFIVIVVSLFGDLQRPPGCGLGQPALGGPAGAGFGADGLRRALPASAILGLRY